MTVLVLIEVLRVVIFFLRRGDSWTSWGLAEYSGCWKSFWGLMTCRFGASSSGFSPT